MSDYTSAAKTLASNPFHAPSRHGGQEPSESQRADKTQYSEEDEQPRVQDQNAFNSERPLNDQPTQSGGVSHVGSYDLPKEKVGLVNDAAIGKTENVIGKATNNPGRYEAVEIHGSRGKPAVTEQACAGHI